jgi:YNFM family putative membrane transporter
LNEVAAASRQGERPASFARLQGLVFALVTAAFTTIYITQPVLPWLQAEFGAREATASLTIAAVVLGIAVANLPFGRLADGRPVRPIIRWGGVVVGLASALCALAPSLPVLVGLRFIQGLFIPALTTCLAAFLARSLPAEKLNVVMGSYVAATVAGGLAGRLIGGGFHPWPGWRAAFVCVALLVLAATAAALRWLPPEPPHSREAHSTPGFLALLRRADLQMIFVVAMAAFFVFSSVFNYLPFYLAGPPFSARSGQITLMYLAYVVGIVVAPLAGRISNRIGNGPTLAGGAVVCGLSLAVTLVPSLPAVAAGLTGVCAGFFAIHAAAAGLLNRTLSASRGRANALYVLYYYAGGAVGIPLSGMVYENRGWPGITVLGGTLLAVPLLTGLWAAHRTSRPPGPQGAGRPTGPTAPRRPAGN